ncbi:hypothetical protein E4U21_006941 [Claviceps maximensis]|nr:hypothetical protein E4U21_006941 [Claviceps maximensis]
MIAVARNGDFRYLPLLMNKVGEILPRMTNPMLQNAPENANFVTMDIFDGFGNAGMAQPPGQSMHMSMDSDYDRKFSAEEYDKKYAMSMTGNTPDSTTQSNHSNHSNHSNGSPPVTQQVSSDIGSSFVGSPSIVPPVMDYAHGMNPFISDMVMSPIGGNAGQPNDMTAGQQHMSHHHDGISQRMNGLGSQAIRSQGMNAMNTLNGISQLPQRQESFHMQSQPHLGGFPNPHRTSAGGRNSMVGIGSMGGAY